MRTCSLRTNFHVLCSASDEACLPHVCMCLAKEESMGRPLHNRCTVARPPGHHSGAAYLSHAHWRGGTAGLGHRTERPHMTGCRIILCCHAPAASIRITAESGMRPHYGTPRCVDDYVPVTPVVSVLSSGKGKLFGSRSLVPPADVYMLSCSRPMRPNQT